MSLFQARAASKFSAHLYQYSGSMATMVTALVISLIRLSPLLFCQERCLTRIHILIPIVLLYQMQSPKGGKSVQEQ